MLLVAALAAIGALAFMPSAAGQVNIGPPPGGDCVTPTPFPAHHAFCVRTSSYATVSVDAGQAAIGDSVTWTIAATAPECDTRDPAYPCIESLDWATGAPDGRLGYRIVTVAGTWFQFRDEPVFFGTDSRGATYFQPFSLNSRTGSGCVYGTVVPSRSPSCRLQLSYSPSSARPLVPGWVVAGPTIRVRLDATQSITETVEAAFAFYGDQAPPPPNEAPTASFTWSVSDDDPLKVELDAASSSDDKGVVRYEWEVDGQPAGSGVRREHIFATPGSYPVKLTVFDQEGLSGSLTRNVTVGGNESPRASFVWTVRKDEPLTVDVDGSASSDDKGIVSYRWTSGSATATGATAAFTFPAPGTYDVTLAVEDAEGATDSSTQRVTVGTGSLQVEIIPQKNPVSLGTDFPDNTLDVYVEVTNTSDVELTNVHVEGGLSIGAIENDEPHKNSQVVPPEPQGLIGTLAPGAKGDTTFRIEARRKGVSELSALVLGFDGTRNVVALGRVKLEVKENVLVELRVRPVSANYRAGQGLRLEGSVRNLSKDKTIGVVAIPVPGRYSNAGNGFLYTQGTTRTPDMPQGWILEPKQELLLGGIVKTFRSAVGGTAEIDYVVKAWVHNDDGSKTNVDAQVKKVSENGYGTPVRIFVAADPPDPDVPGADCGTGTGLFFEGVKWGWVTCGVVVGLDSLLTGGVDLARLLGRGVLQLGDYELRALAWAAQMLVLSGRSVLADPIALQELADEIALDVKALVDAGAMTIGQGQAGITQLPAISRAVAGSLSEGLGKFVTAYAEGDLETLKYETGVLIGENPDLVVEGFLKLATLTKRAGAQAMLRGLARTEQSNAVTSALKRAATANEAAVAEALAKGTDGSTLAKQIPTGATLGDDVLRGLGQSPKDIDRIRAIAKAKNLLIVFRARSAEAARLLERGLAWWKPELIKIKTVNDIDLRYLGGYSRKGVVQFVEPPFKVDLSLPSEQLKAAIKRDADAFVKRLGITDAELAKEVRKRAELRASEWALYHDKFFDGAVPGAYRSGPWQTKGIDVGFDPTKQGIKPEQAPVAKDIRRTELRPAPSDTPGRRAFDVHLEGPARGDGAREFRLITGDTDFLAILNADGTPILDVQRRLEVYELLQGAIGMQHGESLTFAVGAEKRAEFLRCCVDGGEAMVAIGPDGVPTAARFLETKSILDDTVNRLFRHGGAAGDFTLLSGARQQLMANPVLWNSLTVLDVFDLLADALHRYRIFYSPAKLERFVEDVERRMTRDTFDRQQGSVLQPDGKGNLQIWSPGASPPKQRALSTSTATAQRGRWTRISLPQALALGMPGTLELLPQTALVWTAKRRSTTLAVATLADLGLAPTSPWFKPGDRVVVDPGRPREEITSVRAVRRGVVEIEPLKRDHERGAMVSLLPPVAARPLIVRSAHMDVRPGPRATSAVLGGSLPFAGRLVPRCRTQTWRLQIGLSAWTISSAHQTASGHSCIGRAKVGGAAVLVSLHGRALRVELSSSSGIAVANPLAVSFAVGRLARSAEVRLSARGRTWKLGEASR